MLINRICFCFLQINIFYYLKVIKYKYRWQASTLLHTLNLTLHVIKTISICNALSNSFFCISITHIFDIATKVFNNTKISFSSPNNLKLPLHSAFSVYHSLLINNKINWHLYWWLYNFTKFMQKKWQFPISSLKENIGPILLQSMFYHIIQDNLNNDIHVCNHDTIKEHLNYWCTIISFEFTMYIVCHTCIYVEKEKNVWYS